MSLGVQFSVFQKDHSTTVLRVIHFQGQEVQGEWDRSTHFWDVTQYIVVIPQMSSTSQCKPEITQEWDCLLLKMKLLGFFKMLETAHSITSQKTYIFIYQLSV